MGSLRINPPSHKVFRLPLLPSIVDCIVVGVYVRARSCFPNGLGCGLYVNKHAIPENKTIQECSLLYPSI